MVIKCGDRLISEHSIQLQSYRHILKQKIAPLILDVEEEPEDESDVHDADEEDHDHPGVDGEPVPPSRLGAVLSHPEPKLTKIFHRIFFFSSEFNYVTISQ